MWVFKKKKIKKKKGGGGGDINPKSTITNFSNCQLIFTSLFYIKSQRRAPRTLIKVKRKKTDVRAKPATNL